MPDTSIPTTAAPGTAPGGEERLAYRLFTGADDRAFCERVSAALAEGYVLHGLSLIHISEPTRPY